MSFTPHPQRAYGRAKCRLHISFSNVGNAPDPQHRSLGRPACQHVTEEEINVIISLSETENGKMKADDVVKNMLMPRQERQDHYQRKRAIAVKEGAQVV